MLIKFASFISLNFLIVQNLYASCGCIDAATSVPNYINDGKMNYNNNDQKMLNEFMDIANKMQSYYQNFENNSAKLIEDGAKIQYLEDVISSEIVFELKKGNKLKEIEIDSSSTKTIKNSLSNIK